MGWIRSEDEVDKIIEEMKRKTKGKYITQGVTFNKNSKRQMELLKYALMYSSSFSGFGKELIAEKFDETAVDIRKQEVHIAKDALQKGDTGNFF
ncbi:hypothetical protein [Lysinibacillus sp. NPDC086135]|uniref:hypothetical protein n=1 Tax=Lysinibacillus sp. NPDC086135 TaxID=3364130 RepID=UPI00382F5C08